MDRESGTTQELTEKELEDRLVWLGPVGGAYARLEGDHVVIRGEGRPEFTVKSEYKRRLIALLQLPRKAAS